MPKLVRAADLVGIGGTVRNLRRWTSDGPTIRSRFSTATSSTDTPEGHRRRPRRAPVEASRPAPRANPDRADTMVGGGVVVLGETKHLDADGSSSRAAACARVSRLARPTPCRHLGGADDLRGHARRSVRHLGRACRRSAIVPRRAADRRPRSRRAPAMTEMLEYAAVLLDVGKAIDYYERYEHTAMIVTTADLAGFPHRALGDLSAILRYAGGDASMGPFARMILATSGRRCGARRSRSRSPRRSIDGSPPGEPRYDCRGTTGSSSRRRSRRP